MPSPVETFLSGTHIAVVGVSRSAEKYGTKVYRLLAQHGYKVYGVNPNMVELDGNPVFPSLAALPLKPDGVVVIIPPAAAVETIRASAQQGIHQVWLQPGSESGEADQVAAELGITLIRDNCILLCSKPIKGARS